MTVPQRIQLRRTRGPMCRRCERRPARHGLRGYCSPECRFLELVLAEPGGCWHWLGRPHNEKGYGRFDANGRRYLAHRWAHENWLGPVPTGFDVHHQCENTMCVNPGHLVALEPDAHAALTDYGAYQRSKTHCPKGHPYQTPNVRVGRSGGRHCRACDGFKGTGTVGSHNGNARLTEDLVREARQRRARGERVGDLAAAYGVAQSVMSRALSGETWSHV